MWHELKLQFGADQILNHSEYCTSFHFDLPEDNVLTLDDHLRRLRRKVGLYFLWFDFNNRCEIHRLHKLLCVYVGKGIAVQRIKDHAKKKWPQSEQFFVSFFECENRTAKYLGQLFLDTYKFHLNSNENSGTEYLFGYWDEHRFLIGTEGHELGEILVERLFGSVENFEAEVFGDQTKAES